MRKFLSWLLFETTVGDHLLAAIERYLGLAVTPVETIDEATMALLLSIVT